MKLSFVLLLIFGLVAFIGAAPAQEEQPETAEELPKTEDAADEEAIPENESQDEENDDEDEDAEEENKEDEPIKLDEVEDPADFTDEDPAKPKKKRRRIRPLCCHRPFRSRVGKYKGKFYQCCRACKNKLVKCDHNVKACKIIKVCHKKRHGKHKGRHCHYVRRCFRFDVKCYYIGGCVYKKCRRVFRKRG